ncbi:MAG: hypothetical protein QXL01_00025 [Thermoplasmatales archaeon]
MFEGVTSAISSAASNIAGAFGFGKPGDAKSPEKFKIIGQDWYRIYGYQFVILENEQDAEQKKESFGSSLISAAKQAFSGTPISEGKSTYFTLPIPPQNLTIKPIIASEATPTLGGVVEESSENVMWIINMQGTTGIAVSRSLNGSTPDRKSMAKQFRNTIAATGLLSGVAGQLNTTIAKFGGVADSLIDSVKSFKDGDFVGGIGSAVNAANTAVLPALPYAGSAVQESTNGFTEIQELAKFIDTYNTLKHKEPRKYRLVFRMFKTSQQWNCIINDFTIQRSAQSPNLWRYNITLKAWNLKTVMDNGKEEFDRFGPNGDLRSVNTVGTGLQVKLLKIGKQGGWL